MSRHPMIALALLSFAACGGEDDHTIEPGRYAYVARHPLPVVEGDSMVLEGALIVDESTPERIEGWWEATRLHPELIPAEWDGRAYVVTAKPSYGGTAVHRLTPVDGEIRCTGEYTWVPAGEGRRSVPLECTLEPAEGAATPSIPEQAPAVRDAKLGVE